MLYEASRHALCLYGSLIGFHYLCPLVFRLLNHSLGWTQGLKYPSITGSTLIHIPQQGQYIDHIGTEPVLIYILIVPIHTSRTQDHHQYKLVFQPQF